MKNLTFKAAMLNDSRTTVNRRSADGQSQRHCKQTPLSKRWKVLMTLVLLFTMGIGQMWGDTWSPTINSGSLNKDGITITGAYVKDAQVGNNSQKANSLQAKNASVCVFSEQTNITGISFKVCRATNSNSASKAVSIYTSNGGVYAIPTTGFTATNNSTAINSLSQITAVGNNQANANSVSITFTSAVKAIEMRYEDSNGANIHDLTITYDKGTAPTEIFSAVISGSTPAATVTPATAALTLSVTNSNVKTINSNKYYNWNSGNVIDLGDGEKFQVGDQIIADVCASDNKKGVGFKLNGGSDNYMVYLNTAVNAEVCYIVKANDGVAGQQTVDLRRKGSETFVHSFRVLRPGGGETPSCTTPTIAWSTGSTADITAINELAATDLGITVGEYTGDITWSLTGDDIVTLSSESNSGCTVTGKADSYGTATLTASFTLSGDASLCDGTYSISKTIKIVQCTEPAALANEIARFQVPCIVDNTKTLDTYETADYTCTLSGIGGNGNWWQDPNTNWWYAKFSGNYAGNYVKIKLKSGSFKAGDVVTIAVNRNNTTKDGVWIKGNTANTHHQIVPGSTASGVEALGTYTLVASDIEDDGSLSFYRISSNTYVNRIIVTRCAQPEISLQPEGVSLAVGDENPTLSFTATGATSYAWKESSDGTSYDGESALVTTANYTPSVNDVVQTKYYYCELTNACGTVKTDIVTVNVAASINYYTVTLVPAGGTIDDATGWTLNAGNYEKEVAEGTELTLPTFTKENRTFKTWRKAGPTDVTSPITVTADVTLTAVWNATVEQVIYSWEGAEGGATEVGGTAAGVNSGTDNFINVAKGGYYCLQISGGTSYDKYVEITLSGEEKVKTGDKIKYWGFYYKNKSADARPKMRDGNSPNAQIFDDDTNLPNLYDGTGSPAVREFTVPADINTNKVQITRTQTGSNTWIPKLQIIREQQVEEADLRTVTFNSNGGSNIAAVQVASGQAVAKPADPTRAGYRFIKWQKSGVDYDFSTAVTANCTLDAVWQQIWTVTFNANGGSEVAAVIVDNGQIVAEPAAPTRGKYTFLGWFVGDTDDAYDFSAAVTSALTLKAHWQDPWTITLSDGEAAGASSLEVVSITVKHNTSANAEKPADPTWEGHDFNGWFYGEPATAFNWEANVTQDYTIVAQWITQVPRYDVQYYDGETLLGTEEQVRADQHPTATGINTDKSLHSFVCWYTSSTLEGDPVDLNTVTPVEGLKLYGKWAKAYAANIDFEAFIDANGTSGDWQNYLSTNNYAISNTADVSLDNQGTSKPADKGLKMKNNPGAYVSFNVHAGKLVLVKMGRVNGMDASVDGGANYAALAGAGSSEGASVVNYLYNASETEYRLKTTVNGYNIIQSITITDPYTVSFEAHGDADPAALDGHPAVTLPTPTNGTASFLGWFTAETGGTKIGDAGESYTPSADITLHAQWEAISTDARLSAIEITPNTGVLAPAFNMELTEYTYTMPYGTGAVPTITGATPNHEGASYGYLVQAENWGDVAEIRGIALSNDTKKYQITMVQGPKDGVEIISIAVKNGNGNAQTIAAEDISGFIGGTATQKLQSGGTKLGGNDNYIGFTLANSETLKAGDVIRLNVTATNGASHLTLYQDASNANLVKDIEWTASEGINLIPIPAEAVGLSTLYIYRTSSVCNPTLSEFAILRPMDPVMTAITINGRDGEIDPQDDKHFNVTIPFESELDNLTVVPEVVWNAAHATTPTAVVSNGGDWVLAVDGDNTYRVMDKDGDYTDYTITLTRDIKKYTVSFNAQGGSTVQSELVVAGQKLAAAPADPTREDYLFLGWAEAAEGEVVDVTDFVINADKEFYAQWKYENPIVILDENGDIDHDNFFTGMGKGTVNFGGADHNCISFGSTASTIVGATGSNKFIVYNAKTTQTRIKFVLYNTQSSAKNIVLQKVAEGETAPTNVVIEVPSQQQFTTEYYAYNSDENRSMYVYTENTGIKVLQVKVIESGTPIHQAGQAGYVLNLNKGRVFAPSNEDVEFEGLSMKVSSNYKALNSEVLQTQNNLSFKVDELVTMTLVSTGAKYQVSKDPAGSGKEYAAGTNKHTLTQGTWYIVSSTSSNMKFTNISFEEPVADHTRDNLNPSFLGTLCWTNDAILGGATLYEFAGKDEHNYLVFDEVEENRLEAGKPYIFMPENGNTEIKVYNIDESDPMTESQLQPVNNMYGTLDGKTLVPGVDDNMYYFSSNHIWAVKDFTVNIPILPNRCYIDYPAVLAAEPAPTTPAPGRRRVTMGVNGQNVATGMGEIEASETPMKVMIDGQLFIIRGEKMFDATGRLVK